MASMPKLNVTMMARLEEVLASCLSEAEVIGALGGRDWHATFQPAENVLPDARSDRLGGDPTRMLKGRLQAMIDETPIASFVAAYIRPTLLAHMVGQTKLGQVSASLAQHRLLDHFPDRSSAVLAAEITAALISLPRRYTVSFPLSGMMKRLSEVLPNPTEFGPNVRIFPADQPFREQCLGRERARKHPTLADLGEWDDLQIAAPVVQFDVAGFMSEDQTTNTSLEAALAAKAFVGAAIAFKLFWSLLLTSERRQHGYVHCEDSAFSNFRMSFDGDASRLFASLLPNPEIMRRDTPTPTPLPPALQGMIRGVSRIFEPHPTSASLRLACRWYFDSLASRDEPTAFVQAMIVMEILLGDKDPGERGSLGLGELLKNRCAYMLAKDRAERAQILDEFPKLYRVRSAIVHNGHHRLTAVERGHLKRLQNYCARVIQSEVSTLPA